MLQTAFSVYNGIMTYTTITLLKNQKNEKALVSTPQFLLYPTSHDNHYELSPRHMLMHTITIESSYYFRFIREENEVQRG